MKNKKVVFMGTPEYSVPVLKMLIENTTVVGVVTQPDKPVGRKKVLTPCPVKKIALENNIPVLSPAKLKEEYKVSYPTEVITRDMRNLRMDSLYRTDTQLNNIESQSTKVGIKEMKRFADYRTFAEYIYNLPVETIILMTDDPKNSLKEYKISETDILRPIFIYFTKEEVMKRFKNVTDKIENNRKLTEEETLDIAFLPLFAAKENSQEITEKMCELIKKCKQIDYELKREISFILQIMVFKYFDDSKKREQLLGEINMKQYDSDLEMIAMKYTAKT